MGRWSRSNLAFHSISKDRGYATGEVNSSAPGFGVYPFLNDRALELGEDTEHPEERPSGGVGCVNRLLFKVEVASSGVN